MDISNAAKAKYTELLNSAASVVETIKSSAQDSLPALSSTVRTIASLTTVGALVVACLQWKDANRFAEGANKLSLMAFCEEFPVSYFKSCICCATHPSCETPIQMVSGVPYQLASTSESIRPQKSH